MQTLEAGAELPKKSKWRKFLPVILLMAALFLLYGYFLSHEINLVTADLGRHIKNGEMLLQDSSVLERNFYSYTNPDFPVINHHYGSGLIFYLAHQLAGFEGAQILFILLSFAAFAFFLFLARAYAGWGIAGL